VIVCDNAKALAGEILVQKGGKRAKKVPIARVLRDQLTYDSHYNSIVFAICDFQGLVPAKRFNQLVQGTRDIYIRGHRNPEYSWLVTAVRNNYGCTGVSAKFGYEGQINIVLTQKQRYDFRSPSGSLMLCVEKMREQSDDIPGAHDGSS